MLNAEMTVSFVCYLLFDVFLLLNHWRWSNHTVHLPMLVELAGSRCGTWSVKQEHWEHWKHSSRFKSFRCFHCPFEPVVSSKKNLSQAGSDMRCLAAVPLLDAGGNILAVVSWMRWVADVVFEKSCVVWCVLFLKLRSLFFLCLCEDKLREANWSVQTSVQTIQTWYSFWVLFFVIVDLLVLYSRWYVQKSGVLFFSKVEAF